jgi:hypothetical protein
MISTMTLYFLLLLLLVSYATYTNAFSPSKGLDLRVRKVSSSYSRQSPRIDEKAFQFTLFDVGKDNTVDQKVSTVALAGIASNVVCDYSLYVLKTTGCGLPPGLFGLEGALEGVSYLVVVGIFIWSLVTKVSTGSGLPAGKFGLVGLAEGLTFLTILGGIIIAVLNLLQYGFLPGFLPNDQCFGINS